MNKYKKYIGIDNKMRQWMFISKKQERQWLMKYEQVTRTGNKDRVVCRQMPDKE